MDIRIKAIHFDATAKLQEFIEKKANKLVKHHEEISSVEVNLKVVKPETANNKEASVKLIVPKYEGLFASKVADTFEEAVDLCCDALKTQLEKSNKNQAKA
jgi:putative sigma-54 modulation protein